MGNGLSRPNNKYDAYSRKGIAARGAPRQKLFRRPGPHLAGSSRCQLLLRNFAIPFWQSGVMRASAFIREA